MAYFPIFFTIFYAVTLTLAQDDGYEIGRAFYGVFSKVNKRKPIFYGERGHSRMYPEIYLDQASPDNPGAFLYATLVRHYNSLVLPVNSSNATVTIGLMLKLSQIVDVDEKNQIMTTNVWIHHEWYDSNLRWNPADFGGIKFIHIPADVIWLPDTVLYNNADGDYQITMHTKVEVRYDGLVIWEPPSIYKSFCAIDVEYFPYDSQKCEMKFGPWTYDVSKVDYLLLNPDGTVSTANETAADMSGFYGSVEWDVICVTAIRNDFQYPCCQEKYVDVTYVLKIRRKTLFYTVNLIIPCVMIALITVLVFYLPSKSGEKVAFSISTLLSLTWFILLLSEIIPPTSLSLPLMGKYLLFTMVLVTMSIAVTVLVLYNHFRHPYGCSMPYWVRYIFLDVLPMMLWFQTTIFADEQKKVDDESSENGDDDHEPGAGYYYNGGAGSDCDSNCDEVRYENLPPPVWERMGHFTSLPEFGRNSKRNNSKSPHNCSKKKDKKLLPKLVRNRRKLSVTDNYCHHNRVINCRIPSAFRDALTVLQEYMHLPEVREAARCIQYISSRYQAGTADARKKDDWEAVSRVCDRLFLIIFTVASVLGSVAILLRSPTLYDITPSLTTPREDEILPGV